MARNAISTARARRNVRIAQMAAVALGVSAAALWALQVPGIQGPLPEKPHVEPAVVPVQGGGPQTAPSMDTEQLAGTADRLDYGANIQPKEQKPAEQAPAPVATTAAEWKYLAPIREPKRMLAVVSRSGKQKIMAPGREWDGAKLVSVTEEKIVIEDANGSHEILRGERTGSAINWTKHQPVTASTVRGVDPAMAAMEAQMKSRGIDGQQASRFREEIRKSRQRAQAAGLTPEMMHALGLDPASVSSMTPEQIEAMRHKYEMMSETGEAEIDEKQARPPNGVLPEDQNAGADGDMR